MSMGDYECPRCLRPAWMGLEHECRGELTPRQHDNDWLMRAVAHHHANHDPGPIAYCTREECCAVVFRAAAKPSRLDDDGTPVYADPYELEHGLPAPLIVDDVSGWTVQPVRIWRGVLFALLVLFLMTAALVAVEAWR